MVAACIFDLDGVIVDTAKYHYLAWKRLAAELGFTFTEARNERLKGVSRMDSLNILLEEVHNSSFSDREKLALAEKKNAWYVEYISQLTPAAILPGVTDFLQELKHYPLKTALGSASKNARIIIERLQLQRFFDVVIDGTMTTKTKPDPEVFLLAAGALHVIPRDCVVFEDAEAGIEAAIRAGMCAVGVGSAELLNNAAFVIPGFAPSEALERVKNYINNVL